MESVLDIGSGVGKFCVAGALAHGRECRFVGIEQRTHLVAAARELARCFGVEHRVAFIEGTLAEASLPAVQAYYLYNPFGENLVEASDALDDRAELSEARYQSDLAHVRALFARARPGSYVVTYNGFGGDMPAGYERLDADHDLPYALELWHAPRRDP